MERWEPNPNWKDLLKPDVGDIVHLKLTDAFPYTVKVIITAIGDDEITGVIEALFDADTGGWLQDGDKAKLCGKQASFRPCFMQKVIKRNAKS
jgi:hypothetical protein